MSGTTRGQPASEASPLPVDRAAATESARRQLNRVLRWLLVLDVSVVVIVVGLALGDRALHLSTFEFLATVLLGVGAILAARVALAVRLRRIASAPEPDSARADRKR